MRPPPCRPPCTVVPPGLQAPAQLCWAGNQRLSGMKAVLPSEGSEKHRHRDAEGDTFGKVGPLFLATVPSDQGIRGLA